MPPFASVAAGAAFSDFIRTKFQRNIAPVSPSSACFLLLVAFGRCRFRLDLSFVADSLSAVLGCQPDDLRVEFLESRIFTFAVSCKEVGFEIYKIKSLSCDEFELSFHLLNDLGLDAARDFSSDKPAPAPGMRSEENPPMRRWLELRYFLVQILLHWGSNEVFIWEKDQMVLPRPMM